METKRKLKGGKYLSIKMRHFDTLNLKFRKLGFGIFDLLVLSGAVRE
jgi:hypothetical protein